MTDVFVPAFLVLLHKDLTGGKGTLCARRSFPKLEAAGSQ